MPHTCGDEGAARRNPCAGKGPSYRGSGQGPSRLGLPLCTTQPWGGAGGVHVRPLRPPARPAPGQAPVRLDVLRLLLSPIPSRPGGAHGERPHWSHVPWAPFLGSREVKVMKDVGGPLACSFQPVTIVSLLGGGRPHGRVGEGALFRHFRFRACFHQFRTCPGTGPAGQATLPTDGRPRLAEGPSDHSKPEASLGTREGGQAPTAGSPACWGGPSAILGGSVSWGCHNIVLHTGGLKTTGVYSLSVLSPEFRHRGSQGCAPSGGSRGRSPPSPSSGGPGTPGWWLHPFASVPGFM